jgi:hypothetical protein
MTNATLRLSLFAVASCLFVALAPAVRAAEADPCTPPAKRPGAGPHKLRLVLPDDLARVPENRRAIAAAARAAGVTLLDEETLFARGAESQLDAIAASVSGLYRLAPPQTREFFQYADDMDLFNGAGWSFDTAALTPEQLPVPAGWALSAAPGQAVWWVVHFAAPMTSTAAPDWLAQLNTRHIPIAEQGETSLLARMTAEQARRVRRLAGVDWVGRYEAVLKLGLALGGFEACVPRDRSGGEALLKAAGERPQEAVKLVVILFSKSAELRKLLEAAGGKVTGDDGELLHVEGPRRLIRWLARRVEVKQVELEGEKRVGL